MRLHEITDTEIERDRQTTRKPNAAQSAQTHRVYLGQPERAGKLAKQIVADVLADDDLTNKKR